MLRSMKIRDDFRRKLSQEELRARTSEKDSLIKKIRKKVSLKAAAVVEGPLKDCICKR